MKPKFKAPGIQLLKLKLDNLLSMFAFSLNLRRYTMVLSGAATQQHMRSNARALELLPRLAAAGGGEQGLTLRHFSAQLEPCLSQKTPYTP